MAFEIERKFLIEYPDIKALESLENCSKKGMVQTYLESQKDETWRVRSVFEDGKFTYYENTKQFVSNIKRIENEREITKEEYEEKLKHADKTRRPIVKDRYCLYENDFCYEIDVYPFWNDQAIMEVELQNETDDFPIPNIVKVIKEVTGDKEYLNVTLAKIE